MQHKRVLLISTTLLLLAGCGGGDGGTAPGSGNSGTPSSITLSSLAASGSSSAFSAEILEQTPPLNNTGIVLLHGRGGNPDSEVVRQLRHDLFNRGYTTLSIQEPVPATFTEGTPPTPPFQSYIDDVSGSGFVFQETYARIRSAINVLEAKGADKIVLIGFSLGSRMVSAHFANGTVDEIPVIGVIGIGMYGTSIDPLNVTSTLSAITVPVLDIYGDKDTNAAATAAARKSAYESSGIGSAYTQIMLACDAGLTTNECHRLVNLKGSSSSPLEINIASWISDL